MAQVINTNIASLNAQRNLNSSQAGTNQALERLSSGLRINSAKDDAAGLAISTRFTSQINGLNVAVRNANDGISLAETAEASMGSMTDSLQRLRELAVQSANGSYSDADRQLLNEEAQALIAEVGRVADTANFNGVKLLDGSYNSNFQVGANAGETINVSIGKLTTDTLGVSDKNGVTATATDNALAVGDLTINGVAVGASKASDDSLSTSGNSASAISKAAAINAVSAQSGVTAVVDENLVAGTSMTGANASGSISINGTSISITTTTDTTATRASVVEAINAQSGLTGVRAVDTGEDAEGVQLVADDGRNIALTLTTVTAAATGLASAATYEGGYTLVANAGVDEITIGGNNAAANAGLKTGTYDASVAATSTETRLQTGATSAATTLEAGDLVINGVGIGAAVATDDTSSVAAASSSAKEGSAIAIAAAINRSSAETGVTAEANANVIKGTSASYSAGNASMELNGVAITLTDGGTAEANRANAISAINAVAGSTGVVAEDNGSGLTLTAADGRNIVMAYDNDTGVGIDVFGIDTANAEGVSDLTAATTDGYTTYSTVTLKSAGEFTVAGGTNGNAALESLGFEAGSFGGAEAGQFLNEVDLSTQQGSTDALAAIDNALGSITQARSELGAVQNRFAATIENLSATSEKFSAANSRIQDADFAAEAANLARNQALQQAGVSMLAQANASSQQVLQLLG
ncbi:flagellin [Pseudohongiella sp. O18]|uniref:flagellin N-terminal helical domain-containing protein n=1 Tax=Pseudohongiella sp. O18 TaxID=2904248 RepID=UPI001F2993C3|nr:flagellin [Pseudohongiella sp. O18]